MAHVKSFNYFKNSNNLETICHGMLTCLMRLLVTL